MRIANRIVRAIQRTTQGSVVFDNLAQFLISSTTLTSFLANSEHLRLHTLAFLRAQMFFHRSRCRFPQFLRGLSFFLLFQFIRKARGFSFCLLREISLCIFAHTMSNLSLLFGTQSEESRIGLEIHHFPLVSRDYSRLHLRIA